MQSLPFGEQVPYCPAASSLTVGGCDREPLALLSTCILSPFMFPLFYGPPGPVSILHTLYQLGRGTKRRNSENLSLPLSIVPLGFHCL